MDTTYIESLSDEDFIYLESILTAPVLNSLHDGTATADQLAGAKKVDDIIANAPQILGTMIMYRVFKTDSKFAEKGELTEDSYLLGIKDQPAEKAGQTVFRITVEKGTPVLQLSEGSYVLARGLGLSYAPTV